MTEESKIFPNEAFGYWKVTVERPLRLAGTDPKRVYKAAEIKKLKAEKEKDENAAPIVKKVLPTGTEANPLEGRVAVTLKGKTTAVEYEPDTDLRDTEQVPLLHPGGIEAFLQEEVLPYAPDCLVQPRGREGRLRDQLQPALLQAPADALPGGDQGRHPGPGAGDGGTTGGDCGITRPLPFKVSHPRDINE